MPSTKRIIEAQTSNVFIEDLNINLKNIGDRIDLLSKNDNGRPIRTLEQISKSRDLDTLLENGSLFLYNENNQRITGLAPAKSETLALARSSSSASLRGGPTTYVISDGLRVDPGSVLRIDFDDNGISTKVARIDHVHDASDIVSGTFDDSRISESSVIQYASSLTITESQISDLDHYDSSDFNIDFSEKSTTDLAEGINLYYTNERVDDRINDLLVAGTDISLTYNDSTNTLTIDYTGDVGASKFIDLTDTPSSFSGQAGKYLKINVAENSLEFTTIDHTNLLNIGTYTHSQIDTHINSTSNPHSTSDANLVVTDVTTNNATVSAHGFLPKLSGTSTEFLNGEGNWTTPSNSYISQSFNGVTSVNVVHNFGDYPITQVLISSSVAIPFSITHNSVNDFTVTFTSSSSGIILASI